MARALRPGEVVDRYTVEALLGEGGMAAVYTVRHNTLGSRHALKLLKV
jgi:serine/threonine protein kinase